MRATSNKMFSPLLNLEDPFSQFSSLSLSLPLPHAFSLPLLLFLSFFSSPLFLFSFLPKTLSFPRCVSLCTPISSICLSLLLLHILSVDCNKLNYSCFDAGSGILYDEDRYNTLYIVCFLEFLNYGEAFC